MESEVRFYFPTKDYDFWVDKLKGIGELEFMGVNYEKTTQYNHPMPEFDYYDKSKIDARFRIRVIKGSNKEGCLVSWKRRLKQQQETRVNQEEEVELHIQAEEYENLIFIVENSLHMVRVESYERYRNVFKNNEVEIVVDKYPFGVAIEIEAKKDVLDVYSLINRYVNILGLSIDNRYKESWDDKYRGLCREQNITIVKDVLFGEIMPEVK